MHGYRQLDKINFPFYAPFQEVLIKGVEENGQWIVYLEASNELRDQDGETVSMDGLKKSAEYYLGHGVLSWDHKQKQLHRPKFIIGEPIDVKFTDDRKTIVKGFLYKFNEIANEVWNNIRSGAKKLGASIGGGILSKSDTNIKMVIWDETAITHKPINDGTLGNVQLVPFAAFAKSISCMETGDIDNMFKALMAGSGVDAASFTGGRALTSESLQGNQVKTINASQFELELLFNDLLKSVLDGHVNDYNDMVNFVLDRGYSEESTRNIIEYVSKALPIFGESLNN